MTTMTQQLTQGSLRLRPASPSSGPNPQAWKATLGTKPVSARFSLLPETKPRMSALGTSVVLQICLVAIVVTLPLLFPQQMIPRAMYMVTDLAGPPLDIPEPPKPKPPAPPKVAKVAASASSGGEGPRRQNWMSQNILSPQIAPPKAKPRQVEAELPKVNDTFQPLNLKVDKSQPARPREPVKTGMMTSGSSAVPTITKPTPVDKVQTGGFGDPNGIAGPSDPNKRANDRPVWQSRIASRTWLRQRFRRRQRASAELSPAQDSEMEWPFPRRVAGRKPERFNPPGSPTQMM